MEATSAPWNDSAHWFPDGIEGVHLVNFLLWHFLSDCLVVLTKIMNKAQQGAFSFVAHLFWQVAFVFRLLMEENVVASVKLDVVIDWIESFLLEKKSFTNQDSWCITAVDWDYF